MLGQEYDELVAMRGRTGSDRRDVVVLIPTVGEFGQKQGLILVVKKRVDKSSTY